MAILWATYASGKALSMKNKKFIQVQNKKMLPSRWHDFQGRSLIFQQDNAKPQTASCNSFVVEEFGSRHGLPGVQTH